MFFVWTNDGGPLQYIGLGLFLLQVAPQLLQWEPTNQSSSSTTTTTTTITTTLSTYVSSYVSSTTISWMIRLAILFGVLIVSAWQTYQIIENPAVRNGNIRRRISQWRNQGRAQLQEWTGVEWTNFGMSCLFGSSMAFLTLLSLTIRSTNWIPMIYQFVTAASFFYHVFYRGAGGVVAGRRRNNINQQEMERRRQQKMEDMIALVSRIPLESFITQETMTNSKSNGAVPISKLKEMLEVRGVTKEEISTFVERHNLLEALTKCRRYSDSCIICMETYEEGEPLRVLPKCHHEIHVECLDKWVYTFGSNVSKLQQEPTCPLCNSQLRT